MIEDLDLSLSLYFSGLMVSQTFHGHLYFPLAAICILSLRQNSTKKISTSVPLTPALTYIIFIILQNYNPTTASRLTPSSRCFARVASNFSFTGGGRAISVATSGMASKRLYQEYIFGCNRSRG